MQGEFLSAFCSLGAKVQFALGLEIGDCDGESEYDHGDKKIVDDQAVSPFVTPKFRKRIFRLYRRSVKLTREWRHSRAAQPWLGAPSNAVRQVPAIQARSPELHRGWSSSVRDDSGPA